jgi:xanthine dehydrogenase small subunit
MPPVVEPPIASPRSLAEAFALLADGNNGDRNRIWRPVAGGTDVYVQLTGELGPPPARLLDVWRIDELRGVVIDGTDLVLGALTTYTEIRRSPLIREHVPALVDAAATIGAAQIQNRGTIGGNVANASPAGDTLPILLAADATIVVGGARGERRVPAADFWPRYRATVLAADELVLAVRLPIDGREIRFRKVGTRRAQAISKVVIALAWQEQGPGRAWRDVRLGLGSVAATPIRAATTEGVLDGRRPTPETADLAAETLAREIHPIDDVRSTAEYRRVVAARVLHRLIREAGGW